MNKIGLSASIAIALTATSVSAANYSVDGRGDAMGGTGVVSADFLTAPFYNPALAALYRRNDNAGMILPGLGISYTDQGDLLGSIDTAGKASNESEAAAAIAGLQGDQLALDVGGTIAFAIPNSFVSMNVFGKIYSESYVTADMDTSQPTSAQNLDNSLVKVLGIGVSELGMTFAKYYTVFGQHMSFGVSPKIQRVYSIASHSSFSDFDTSKILDSASGETAFNLDAGAVWFYGPWRVGFSAMNIMGREIETKQYTVTQGTRDVKIGDTYKLDPNYTVGAGIVGDYFAFSVDYDILKREKFVGVDDDAQMLRVGIEGDIMRQMQLRAGYYTNLASDNDDGTITAGIGLSPLNIITLDIGASYTNENSMGVYINFLSNY
ncbi:conjugal transfer protein TraF [Vibrio tapetis]|uniref:Conjugal transfer protein TraF n=2 Tax=Vibrio tapetis TaxID=52443 RepID=A0A2N8ZN54_9VIBR|nr:conjugal transfer protein TraF [Vibrio tapetis]AIY26226.1 conserved outer membrane protein [Vibrio tapetis]SON53322.1 conserved exported protein of unknown function [Vibrio tapetis subsp. tapetis]